MSVSAANLLTLRQLEYALAVAEHLSFRRAAEACHVSQPSLSAQLAQLEDSIGVRLFERDRRHVLLTSAGSELIARARAVMREADDLVEAARAAKDPLSGTMRIGVIPTISPYLLPHITPPIRENFPKLSIVWVEDKTEVLVERLDSGEIEAALLALEAELGDVEQAVIARDNFVLAAPPEHVLSGKKGPVKPSDLRDENVLLLDEGHCFREQALTYCSRARAQELEFRATSLPTLVQMVAGGAGVTLLPELSLATEARRAELTVRRFAEPEPHRTIALIWRKGSPVRNAARTLAESMKRCYASALKAPKSR